VALPVAKSLKIPRKLLWSIVSHMDSSGAEKTLPLAFPLPLCPGGVKAGGLPQYLPLG